jgi:TRAP-type mannitol/chloroaromatic compound transport system permease small subunit
MNMLARAIDAISEAAGKLAAWGFFAIALAVTFEVVVRADLIRDLFGTAPTKWVDEISRIAQIWATFLAAAFVLKHRQMVVIDVAFRNPDTLARRLTETLAIAVMLIFTLVSVYHGFGLWLKSTLAGHTTDSFLAPPKWFTHASVWVGLSLLSLQGLVELWRVWTVGVPKSPPAGEDP